MSDSNFEPRIVGIFCNWCSYRAADLAGSSRLKHAPNVRVMRVMCSGRVEPDLVLKALARGGRLLTVGNTTGPKVELDLRYLFVKQISWLGSTMGSHHEFASMIEQVWRRRLRPVVDRVLPLSAGVEAVGLMERGEQFGKLVLTP